MSFLTFSKTTRSLLSGHKIARNLLAVRNLATVSDSPVHSSPFVTPAGASTSSLAALKLKSGQVFKGTSFGGSKSASGEAVFTTSLVGYPESMTDPSYRGQILVFTQPLIGNYGVPGMAKDEHGLLKYFESEAIHCRGIVVSDYATKYSHWNAVESLGEWCARYNIPAISGVDTRAIVHILRDQGSTLGQLAVGKEDIESDITQFEDPNQKNLVAEVSTKVPIEFNPKGDVKIAVVDCGIKQNIIRCLVSRGAHVTLLPWDYDYNKEANKYDGLFISNGPGSPKVLGPTVHNLQKAISNFNKPIFGICMGNLVLGLAAGLDSYKLRFGNRGHNQPAVNVTNGQCVITSQNHGYALKDDELPSGWAKYFINANDGSNEGIRHLTKPIRSVQFHPEAKGGPQDTEYLFNEFIQEVRAEKAKRYQSNVFVEETIPVQKETLAVA
ncbi:small subunit of carbamoyl-phosphate synthase [Basidiobolus meristosporus CBS 931.73]|uniref:Carbamoyl phosphate synthase arginine-specific small chain n=1 Tax=Basidiobolus meristosporus CBS 931.73 TaxID=1314790 RepID=A0A1Y1Y8D8_9FUNG|nr:small subunit of carbamoyl-phosphate synthase [Basidiobolus meristosporus CBS 931.73]|eukprot:ORX94135.1 small subunit of carbamoyl-phosphate synthase [Basidiobolus meristosporus CBS 931.73]